MSVLTELFLLSIFILDLTAPILLLRLALESYIKKYYHCLSHVYVLKFNFKFLLFSLFSQLCKKHTKLVDQIRHAAVTGGQKQETESEDQDPEQDYVIIIINGVAITLKMYTH